MAHSCIPRPPADPCACYGSGLAIVPSGATAPNGACVGGEGGGPRCWNATSNVYRYHNLLESLAFVSSGASSAVLDGGGEVHVDGTGIMVTAFPEKLSCRLSFIRSPGALSADRAAAEVRVLSWAAHTCRPSQSQRADNDRAGNNLGGAFRPSTRSSSPVS